MRRFLVIPAAAAASWLLFAQPASACGGLVARNGAVRLERTTTLAAYHQGVERYVTSFQYAAAQDDFGSIIPLPGVPTDVRKAGSWTLQRLERETHPQPVFDGPFRAASVASTAPGAQVLLQTAVDALDITVLSGGGPAVLDWVKAHGYAVSADAPAMVNFYAQRSPVFLAARFNAARARARGQVGGDGTPVLITIPTPNPWVPFHILSLAKGSLEPVQADVFLLTDRAPTLLGLDSGVSIQASEAATPALLDDLRSDRDSDWVPNRAWLTFVKIDTAAGKLTHDLAIDASGAAAPSPVQAAYDPTGAVPLAQPVGLRPVHTPHIGSPNHDLSAIIVLSICGAVLALGAVALVAGRRAHARIGR
jgi:hypothetical protein